jgi:hypothetical protein
MVEYSLSTHKALAVLGFELRASCLVVRKSITALLHQPFFVLCIFEIGLSNYLSGLASSLDPPDFYLLSS